MEKQIFTYNDAELAINSWAKEKLTELNIEFDSNGEIPFFIQYLNYRSKLITVRKRTVSYAKNFSVKSENQAGFNTLVALISNGDNVNAYLSKGALKADIVDGMLDNFGIKHFHLGSKLNNEFIERTEEIALGLVTPDEVFFIISKLHGKGHGDIWYEKDVLEIIHSERPELIGYRKVSCMENLEPIVSETKDIKELRKQHLVTAVTLSDGTSYMPSMFQSLSGFPIEYSEKMTYQARNIYLLADKILKENSNIQSIEINRLELTDDGEPDMLEFKIYDGVDYKIIPFYGKPINE